jgi:hypothetical protein
MKKDQYLITIPEQIIVNKILQIRGQIVMIDSDLAELYNVPTKRLNEQVKRNILRFPADFMFQLTEAEKNSVMKNTPHLEKLKHSSSLPFAFTEHGAVMLASVLKSERAIQVNIQVVRAFILLRKSLPMSKDILSKIEILQTQIENHHQDIDNIFDVLKQLIYSPNAKRKKIGFKQNEN